MLKDREKTGKELIDELARLRGEVERLKRRSPPAGDSGMDEGQSEQQFRMLIEALPDIVLTVDRDGRYLKVLAQRNSLLAAPPSELEGKLIHDSLPREIADQCLAIIQETFDSREGQVVEYELDVIGGHKWFEGRTSPLLEPDGAIRKVLWIARDVTERKQAEEEIKAALAEKEILLKEIYHRVNNNLQIIISLLKLQAGYIADRETRELFQQNRNRITSMAIIHEMLYQAENLANIDFPRYVRKLADYLCYQYSVNPAAIRLEQDIEGIRLNLNTAIPCGLIVNELLSNCLSHCFPEGTEGIIRITMRRSATNEIKLTIENNGISFPEDLSAQDPPSFGLELIHTLARQLGGELEIQRGEWTVFRITFQE